MDSHRSCFGASPNPSRCKSEIYGPRRVATGWKRGASLQYLGRLKARDDEDDCRTEDEMSDETDIDVELRQNEEEDKAPTPKNLPSVEDNEYIPEERYSPPMAPPPDLSSMLLHNRMIYMGLPISSQVTELMVTQLLYLNYESRTKPIYLYINSSGSETTDRQPVTAFESEALAIADVMNYIQSPVHTIAIGQAWGTAALLLSKGLKGRRFCLPNTSLLLRQAMVPGKTSGWVSDVAIRVKEAIRDHQMLCEMVSASTGRPFEEVDRTFRAGRYFTPREAIEFGLIDQVFESTKDLQKIPSFIKAMNRTDLSGILPSSQHTDDSRHRGLFPGD
eukprot:GHVS01025855.1.p1 GENE.GHVS01025855.1~~GHVS01025855.1.p1  ORF type:complete len:343 (-),score=32.98 GHVS01025855.1:248-1246(-)